MRSMVLLVLFTVVSALAVEYSTHRSRTLFAEIQRLEDDLARYDEEWEQLQTEQNTWAEHSRIESLARVRLGMVLPQRESIIYIKP